jgi:signal transduction histidine kinase
LRSKDLPISFFKVGKIFLDKLFGKKPLANSQNSRETVSDAQKSAIVINSISDGIAIVDQSGIIQLFNPAAAAMTGWPQNQAENLDFRSIFQLLSADKHEIPDDQNPILIALKSGQAASRDNIYLQTNAKKHLLVSLKATPITEKIALDEKQLRENQNLAIPVAESVTKIAGVVVVFRDITRERADQNAQTEFISTASHEMRTPVAIIEGYLGMLLNPATATVDSRGLEYAEKAHEAAQHLGRLFQDLLDVTKADDRRTHTELVLVDAGAAARQVVEEFQSQALAKNLTLTYESGQAAADAKTIQPLYIIYVDLDQLKEILGNMVENAIKYTHVGGVVVSVRENAGRVRFEVRDTGIGIPAEDVPHLFQKFYRVDNSDTREIGGTGLGLYLIKKLAENLGGQVGVASEYEKGSTFFVEFDRLSRDQAIAKAEEMRRRENPPN